MGSHYEVVRENGRAKAVKVGSNVPNHLRGMPETSMGQPDTMNEVPVGHPLGAPMEGEYSVAEHKRAQNDRSKMREQLPQPAATRAYDPRYNPTEGLELQDNERAGRLRWRVRQGYMFFWGEKDAFKGPTIIHATREEVKGQEQKLELIDDKPVQMIARSVPHAVSEHMSARDRVERIERLRVELDTLIAEHEVWMRENQVTDDKTLTQPVVNEESEASILHPTGEKGDPGGGDVAGPSHNPDAETPPAAAATTEVKPKPKTGGRPAGQKARVRRVKAKEE